MRNAVIVGIIRDPEGVVKSLGPLPWVTGVGSRVQNRKSFQGNSPGAKEV